jgi:hypothetical protein
MRPPNRTFAIRFIRDAFKSIPISIVISLIFGIPLGWLISIIYIRFDGFSMGALIIWMIIVSYPIILISKTISNWKGVEDRNAPDSAPDV